MKAGFVFLTAVFLAFLACSAAAQALTLVHDPRDRSEKPAVSQVLRELFDRTALPTARGKLADEGCEESLEFPATARGSFTRKGVVQTAVFYQFCQTGNGFGKGGVAVFEDDKLAASFVSQESGWTVGIKALPDINMNGTDEIALYVSGGMHQGSGGTGVEIVEVSGRTLKSIGWFQAESFSDDSPVIGYKVSAKRAATPGFIREKYVEYTDGKWRRVGTPSPLKLRRADIKFERVD
jgi:hypothetical protein